MHYIVFALVPMALAFGGIEIFLRAIDFKYSDRMLEMQWPDHAFPTHQKARDEAKMNVIKAKRDARQFWVPVPSFEDSHPIQKAPGVTRIATLGCSCTATCVGSQETYPSYLEKVLNATGPGKVEILNAAVGSYSTFQGLQRLKYAALPYRPDIVTIFFGWNDHWITFREDKDLKVRSDFEIYLLNFLEFFRTYQGYHWLIANSGKLIRGVRETQAVKLRVSPQDFTANLNQMIDLAQQGGAKVLLITAPSDFRNFKPFSCFPLPKENVTAIHEKYVEIVRHVAAERKVGLLDLAAAVSQMPADSVLSRDGIHFRDPGCRVVAEMLANTLRRAGWIK